MLERAMTQLLAAATEYVAGNVSVIPVHEKLPYAKRLPKRWDEKRLDYIPSWLEYQERHPTPSELETWFTDPNVTGVAGVGGPVSGNLCILDFDAPRLFGEWRSRMRAFPAFRDVEDLL